MTFRTNKEIREWARRILAVPPGELAQDQRATDDQITDLRVVAVMLGMYDAADAMERWQNSKRRAADAYVPMGKRTGDRDQW